jgi:hypothetical protein
MQRTDDYIRPRGYYDNQGNLLSVNFNTINQLSGLTATAGQLNYATSYPASASYAVSAGALSGVTVTAGQINNILYGTALFKYAIGSVLASNGMTMSHGLTSALYCIVSPQTGGTLVGGHVSGSQITFFINTNAGIFFETSSAIVDWIVFGD